MNYEELLPIEPSHEMTAYARSLFRQEYLIYRVAYHTDILTGIKEKMVRATCTACEETGLCTHVSYGPGCHMAQGPAFGLIHPQTGEELYTGCITLCPYCGAEVRVMHIGSVSCCNSNLFLMGFDRITVPGEKDRFACIGWCFQRFVDKEAKSTFRERPYEAYVIEDKKVIRLTGYEKYMTSVMMTDRWQQRVKCYDTWGTSVMFGRPDTDGTTAENSALREYLLHVKDATPVTYLRLWQKHRNAENLVVQGAAKLLQDLIDEHINSRVGYYGSLRDAGFPQIDCINWKEVSPAKMLGMNKTEFGLMKKQNWGHRELKLFRLLQEKQIPFDVEKDRWMLSELDCATVRGVTENKHLAGIAPIRVLRYLHKQGGNCWWTLDDYLRMAEGNGVPLDTERQLLPKDLRFAHDYQMRVRNEREELERSIRRKKEIESRQALFEKRAAELQKFDWAFGGYLIEACPDEEALIREGKILEHCVATYAARICKGVSAIFFIRRQKNPDEPFYTLELDEKTLTVQQNRGKRNCARTAAVQKFEERWLEHIRSLPAKKREVKTA